MMNRYKLLSVLSLSVLLLGACSTMDNGGIYGGGNSNPSNYEIRGTVDSVDLNSHSIYLTNVSGYNTSMLSGGGNNVRVYYDDRTTVAYQGQSYRPQDLERGDEIAVRVDESGNSLVAESVTVTRDVTNGSVYGSDTTYGTTVRGTVRSIDTSRRTIEIDRGYGTNVMVEYDTSLPVYFNNQTYRVTDLERGDEVEIRGRDLGNSRYLAQDITVTRSISAGNTSGSSTQYSTVRGTVRSVDTARRTIELESASWISGFNTGAGSGSRMIFQYDTNVGVSVSGQLHPVENLESGDVVEVQFRNSNAATPFADRITLVRDVRR